ncbi:DUF2750 domain-containing protein [Asticcacaulis sp. ZE23SCel15]|uniref:DUF2750 domain-containing protein n=1 Tax=Asticcacaulis sp. ZE23SCel15 TaxID=3059027 RepID=UPI0026602AAE|nr:DUF2750 domain-containing protein [Asticcacaulis sp. ZE23SCel15]WKL55843.1 DUF2750 domain-containing protein [Asticcacaulis sp. ZE23SCel15]
MSISSINADAFIVQIIKDGRVWGIRDKDGFPASTNMSGETAMPFWSSNRRAQTIIEKVPAYSGFEPEPIELPEFIDRWLPGLEKDGLYCGLNWTGSRATGYDLTPAQVLARITARQALLNSVR